MDKNTLILFENDIANMFNAGRIRSPVHLYHGNEDLMIKIFEEIDKDNDWVCCTWRNHYQAILKNIPIKTIKDNILDGKSMVMNLPEYKFLCSSIVAGIVPIATGIALSIKLQNKKNKVWCWIGDMAAETGIFHESYKYSLNHDLPITFIVEDNMKSVCTPTNTIWNRQVPYYLKEQYNGNIGILKQNKLYYYQYTNTKYPHSGAGVRVQF